MSSVRSDTPEFEEQQLTIVGYALPSDPLLSSQFNLNNTGQTGGLPGIDINVFPVWEDYRGSGVTVGIIDDGVEHTHPDLIANYDASIDFDSRGGDNDAMAEGSDAHGTAVAGIIAADDNGLGSVGVAPDATIAGFRMGFGADGTLNQITENLQLQVNVDISNNSWGFGGFFGDNFKSGAFRPHRDAIDDAVTNGRDGLGTVWLFAAGNSRTSGDDVNYHSFQNSRKTIAVAAAEDDGDITFYSTPGASVITTAPVAAGGGIGGVFSTDRQGSAGYTNSDITSGFNGTSAATPMVSGVVALMLEANPDLGYRDVQEILAYSSRQIDASDPGWQENGGLDWNGGGLHVSHDFGFGLVDAHAAVRLAESWDRQSTAANEQVVSAASTPILAILDNATVTDSITITDPIDLQWVEVDILIDHSYIGDLVITLTSPDGTSSTLVNRPGKSSSNTWGTSQDDINFVLTSARHWGEDATGTWTLSISDHFAADDGTLFFWSLNLYGDALTGNNDYVYTDEYGTFAAADASRRELSDSGGSDRINAAALTAGALIDLNAGNAGSIAGQAFSIAAGTLIEDVIGGDGGDTLTGNAAANDISGARGDDVLTGGDGNDTLSGGAGSDRFIYAAGDGDDLLTDFDTLSDVLVLDGIGGIFDLDDFIASGRVSNGGFEVNFQDGALLTLVGLDPLNLTDANLELRNTPEPEPDPEPVGPVALSGGETADVLTGTAFDDTISGEGGTDNIEGGAGSDSLLGDAGADTIDGGDGNDTVRGGTEGDLLYGGGGQDTLLGQSGNDELLGGVSGDRLAGGDGADSILGESGDDVLTGDAGQDTVRGGNGADTLFGGADNDILLGNDNSDYLSGDAGDDRIAGDAGDDSLLGGAGVDVSTGDAGDDTIRSGEGDDRSYGGDGNDTVFGDTGDDFVSGDAGDDRLLGGGGHDSVLGGDGIDVITGEDGDDTLRGGNDDDRIFGGEGADIILGDAGNDLLEGDDGSDRLVGGAGADTLRGGTGNDVITGGSGADRFEFAVSDGSQSFDTVTDFSVGEDSLLLARLTIADQQEVDLRSDGVLDTRLVFDNGATLDLLGVSGADQSDLF